MNFWTTNNPPLKNTNMGSSNIIISVYERDVIYRWLLNPILFPIFQMDVKLALCQMIGQSTGMGNDLHDLNEKDIVHKQKLCMEILNVANVISPGINPVI